MKDSSHEEPEIRRGDKVAFPFASGYSRGLVIGFDREHYVVRFIHGTKVHKRNSIYLVRRRESRLLWRLGAGLGLIQKEF